MTSRCTESSSYLAIFCQFVTTLSWSFAQSMASRITSTISIVCPPHFLFDSLESDLLSVDLPGRVPHHVFGRHVHFRTVHSRKLHTQPIFRLNSLAFTGTLDPISANVSTKVSSRDLSRRHMITHSNTGKACLVGLWLQDVPVKKVKK